ncbi:hypothetical protein Ais01nite_76470 [Asanoa ishikariensis]|uniref:Uncharacterized protein n=1 Tax=Asanoa ishikariensis TaxID=137265 RepID=A0A1H3KZS5_9ACTN|nr:hypothetical protein [Asanoa ishikariensis]GIF69612.1 hypothetical protein Ais01nite_76470 [Asanoa ishikariensis]SDY57135.1 hypothetical protein SAMN05421684_0423 [Asanoa ishikariensis]
MTAETMVGFGRKQAWLAIRGHDPGAVVEALGLRDLGPAPWREGVDLAHLTDDRLAVTPPLPGARDNDWILVAGRRLFTIPSTVEAVALSVALATEVQFFATHRVGEQHRWVRAVDGVLVRAFDFVGETGEVTEWRGDPDDAERSLGLPETAPDPDDLLISEDDVTRLAGQWSVDPTALGGRPSPGPLHVAAAPE